MEDRDYALVIGINDYPAYQGLSGAIADAERFAAWARKPEGGGIPEAQCTLMRSAGLRPIDDEVDEALSALIDLARKNGGGRRFYLFFAGHGLAQLEESHTHTAFCLGKWSKKRRNYALDSNCYLNHVIHSGQFVEVVLFADCCRVREVKARGACPTEPVRTPFEGAGGVRRFEAYGAELMDQTFEAATGADGTEIRGHFSRALVDALEGAAARPEGGVPARALQEYLSKQVPRIALAKGHKQKPEISTNFDPANEPVFGRARPLAATVTNVRITFANRGDGIIDLEGPDLSPLGSADASNGDWTLALNPGLYRLVARGSRREQYFRVRSVTEVCDVTF